MSQNHLSSAPRRLEIDTRCGANQRREREEITVRHEGASPFLPPTRLLPIARPARSSAWKARKELGSRFSIIPIGRPADESKLNTWSIQRRQSHRSRPRVAGSFAAFGAAAGGVADQAVAAVGAGADAFGEQAIH